jgi:hypothetical protein
VVFADLFARPWMVAMGMDPDDKAKIAEMQKGAAKMYTLAFIASLISAFVLGKLFARLDVADLQRAMMYSIHLGGLRRDGAVHRHPIRQQTDEAVVH